MGMLAHLRCFLPNPDNAATWDENAFSVDRTVLRAIAG